MWWVKDCSLETRLDGKTAIITGCNSGIGKYNVLDFYRRGCRVIMACRNAQNAERAKREIIQETLGEKNLGHLIVRYLDLASFRSIRGFAKVVMDEEENINILVNNAGVAGPYKLTEDVLEMTMATNYLGPYLLTLLLLPRILKSAPARIINLSSLSYIFGRVNCSQLQLQKTEYVATTAYVNSKLAIMLFTRELAYRLNETGVTAYSVHPGLISTGISDRLGRCVRTVYTILTSPVNRTVQQGAQTQIYCAVQDTDLLKNGGFYSDCKLGITLGRARDNDTAARLWTVTWMLVGLEDFDPFTPR